MTQEAIAQGYLKSIYAFYLQKIDQSLTFLLNILKSEKMNKLGILFYGILMIFKSDYNKAVSILDIYARADPDLWYTYLLKSYSYFKLGQTDKMRENLNELVNKQCFLDYYFDLESIFKDEYFMDDLFTIVTDYLCEFTKN
jgi:tetratricopeptide (TPR) repeat protein